MDWIEVYSEARVAFPADVFLRTVEAERGGVEITAYRDEFDPPLPSGEVPPESHALSYEFVPFGDERPKTLRAHVKRTVHMSYVVHDERLAGRMTQVAARQWASEAAQRGQG